MTVKMNQLTTKYTIIMKKLLLLSALLVVAACSSPSGYTIKGTVTGDESLTKSGEVYLVNRDKENPIRDTAALVDGKFTFKGNVVMPETYAINIKGIPGRISLFLENANYTLTADASKLQEAEVNGGITQELINEVNRKSEEFQAEMGDAQALIDEYRSKDVTAERKEEISVMFENFQNKINAFEDSVVKANPLTHYALNDFANKVNDMDINEAKARLEEFRSNAEFAGHKTFAKIEESIKTIENVQIGMPAPEFSLPTPEGKEVSLSSVYKKNKITMIDFWAGWCNPCRQFNPQLVKIYQKYHKKGFEVLGVSLDRDRETWLNAIKTDKLPWIQVSDIKYWDCAPAKLYAVRYIPQNAFVDQDGNILARKLSEEEIVKFLEEHLK